AHPVTAPLRPRVPGHGSAAELDFSRRDPGISDHRPGLHPPRWAHQRHVQRGAAILPHRCRLSSAGVAWIEKRGRMERNPGAACVELHAFLAGPRQCAYQSAGRGMVWVGDGAWVRAVVWLLVYGFARTGLIPPKLDAAGQPQRNESGEVVLDYDLAIPNMLMHYLPTGLLGLGLTALLASFMSGMAGNVTAFNTVWTYDIYQSYIN